jgi:hypothetical protein
MVEFSAVLFCHPHTLAHLSNVVHPKDYSVTVANVTFAEGTNRTMVDAVTMKANNGASAAPSSFTDTEGAVTGFIIDPQSGGHFCYWKNSASGTNKWALSRYNNPPPGINPFNYTLRVCNEVE